MAFARVQGAISADPTGTGGSFATTVAVTLGATVTSGSYVMGVVTCLDGKTIDSVTDDKSNVYDLYDVQHDTYWATYAKSFVSRNPITNAPQTITATFSGSINWRRIEAEEYSGLGALDKHVGNLQANPGTGTDAVTTTAVTPTNDGSFFWCGYQQDASPTVNTSNGTSFSSGIAPNSANALPMGTEYYTQGSKASQAGTWTLASSSTHTTALTFLLVFAPPAITPLFRQNPMTGLSVGGPFFSDPLAMRAW